MGRIGKSDERRSASSFGAIDGAEAIFFGLAGLALFGFVLYLAHVAVFRVGGPVALGMAIAASVLVMGIAARDARRRRWSPASMALIAAYLLCVLAVIVSQAVDG